MSSIFDVAEAEFRFTGNHMAELHLEGHHPIHIESFQVYIVLGGSDLRVKLDLASDLPLLPTTMTLRHPQSAFVSSIRPDERSRDVSGSGAGTRFLDAIPDSLADQAIFLHLLRSAVSRLPDDPQRQTPP